MKTKILFFGVLALVLLGAGCAAGPQATIKSPTLGKTDAPVQITEYFDFQCPSCKEAESAVVPFIVSDYVDTGKAAMTFKNMSFIGPESTTAAIASLCAAEQDKFFDYYKKLYEVQGAENSGVFTNEKLKRIAGDLGLNAATFGACLDGQKYSDQVAQETREGGAQGVDSTPTFIINGQKVVGGTYLTIKRVIDNKLGEIKK